MMSDQRLVYLDPREIISSGRKVRSEEGDIAGLAATIRQHGLLQPLGVTQDAYGYRLIYGHRRRDAAIVAGMERVPCILVDAVSEDEAVVPQVLENLQRLDLNDMDKCRAFSVLLARLISQGTAHGEALNSLADTLGLSVRQIQRYLRLSTLNAQVQQLIAQDALSVTQAQHLAEITPQDRQLAVAELVVEESLSAAETGRLCEGLRRNKNIEPATALAMLRRGERIPVVEMRVSETVPQFNAAPAVSEAEAPWEEPGGDDGVERVEPDNDREDDAAPFAPVTQDGNRVRRIHSLDSFMDELQRLTACVQEGDLQHLIEQDEGASLKLTLAARQLKFLAEAVSALAALN